MKSTNDVHSEEFESKLDPFFTSAVTEGQWGKYERWDKDLARSALATTKPLRSKSWGQQSKKLWSGSF